MLQTAEGAMDEVHSILQRMRELAVQAANRGGHDTTASASTRKPASMPARFVESRMTLSQRRCRRTLPRTPTLVWTSSGYRCGTQEARRRPISTFSCRQRPENSAAPLSIGWPNASSSSSAYSTGGTSKLVVNRRNMASAQTHPAALSSASEARASRSPSLGETSSRFRSTAPAPSIPRNQSSRVELITIESGGTSRPTTTLPRLPRLA